MTEESVQPDESGDPPAHDLLTRLRSGDEQAAAELFDRYARRLVGLRDKS